jgi:SpoVK/Ycf46/Vps4 family AAA+-type ATPase
VTLDDLVVGDELRAALQGALDAARAGRRTVVLLHGPPGSGKTHAAACLAGSLERPLLRASGAEVRGCFYGEMERALRDLFDRAANEGCVLLLDEADEWVGRRAAGSSAAVGGVRIAECGEVLQRLERFTGVAVLATNRLTALDPAVFRRCDLVLYLEPPGEIERLALWAQAAGGAVLLTATDLTLLAALPLTGGEIAAAVADARSRGAELTAVGLMAAARRRADLGMLQGS